MQMVGAAAAVGVATGVAVSFLNRAKKNTAKAGHETTTLADLEK
jgi:hydrogenase small subunit